MTHHHKDCDLSIAEIALRLGGAKKAGKGFLCKCPVHDDRQSSLSLDENAKSDLLVHCLAGCSQEDVIEALKGLDLWRFGASKRDPARVAQPQAAQKGSCLIPIPASAPPPPTRHTSHGKPTTISTYRDALGAACFHILRFDFPDGTKAFTPLSYWEEDGKRRWRWCMVVPGENRPLFNLDQLAAWPNAVIIVVEGEKCAAAAARIFPDAVIVTSSGGVGAILKTDWTPLRGRYVVAWPDINEPGLKYMDDIAAILGQPIDMVDAEMLAAIDPSTGMQRPAPPKFDSAYALEEGWAVEALARAAIHHIKPFKHSPRPVDGAGAAPPPCEKDFAAIGTAIEAAAKHEAAASLSAS